MKVVLAKTSGFCHGVERAVTLALEAAARGPVRADGPLLHNRQALALLERRGVNFSPASASGTAAEAEAEAEAEAGAVLIRAHGAAPARRGEWTRAGLRIVDATCVHVARSQRLAGEANGHVALAGDAGHAEVLAVAAACAGGCTVVRSVADIESLPADPAPVLLLAQTTFNAGLYREMAAAFARRFPDAEIADTICRATHVRQEEAGRLARAVDVMVVVGDRHSANTARLADIAREAERPVFLVETALDLNPAAFAPYGTAGVTSGASTPGWVTQEVVDRLSGLGRTGPAGRLALLLRRAAAGGVTSALSAAGLALAAQAMTLGTVRIGAAIAAAGVVFLAQILGRAAARRTAATLLSAAGLALLLAGPAWLEGGGLYAGPAAAAFVFLLSFGAGLLRDLHDPASDRLLGLGSIPLWLGAGAARRFALAAFAAAAAIPPGLALAGILCPAGAGGPALLPLLMLAPVWGREVLELQFAGRLRDAVHLRAALDAIGVMAGAAAIVAVVITAGLA